MRKKLSIYYNLTFKNCQHFACDIEKILFGKIQFWHSFDYYLKEFYQKFFEKININELQNKIFNKYENKYIYNK